jgi:hypothetical protein
MSGFFIWSEKNTNYRCHNRYIVPEDEGFEKKKKLLLKRSS